MTTTYQKTSAEVLDYTINWATFLVTDTISTSTWSLPAGITTTSNSNTTTTTSIFLATGAVDKTYLISNTITTAGGRTVVRSFSISIVPYEYV